MMTCCLNALCGKACATETEGTMRRKPQSFTCSDIRSKSELTVRFTQSAQGIAFVTDHVIPLGGAASCDWCVCHCDAEQLICKGLLVELKGRNFRHAVEQLFSTYSAMRTTWPKLKIVRTYAVLSGRQIPSVKSSDYRIVGQCRLPNFKHFRARKELSVQV